MSNTTWSRRSFLATSAAALAALAVSKSWAADAADEYGGLPMGIQSYTLRSLSFDKALDAIKNDLKLTRVEIYPGHPVGQTPPQIRQKCDDRGLTITGWGVVNFTKSDDNNRKIFETAKILGIKNLTCSPSADSFDSLDKLTEEYGMTVAIHDHGPTDKWGKIDVINEAIKNHSKKIGLCDDTGHFITAGEDPFRALEVFGDRVYGIHLKDFKKRPDSNRFDDVVIGDGTLKYDPIIKWLLDHNFKGTLSLEYEGGNPVDSAKEALDRVKKSVAAAKKA